jgi:hypothetical protein
LQIGWSGQASGMRGEDSLRAVFHGGMTPRLRRYRLTACSLMVTSLVLYAILALVVISRSAFSGAM